MKLEAVPFNLTPEQIGGILPALQYQPPQPRSIGLHLGTVIRDLAKRTGRGKKYGDDTTPEDFNRRRSYFEAGFAWEMVMEAGFKMRQWPGFDGWSVGIRQPEMLKDGIYCTGDLVLLPDYRYAEMKWTTRSAKRVEELEEDFWDWFVQIKANCHVHDTNLGALFVMFAAGNYKPPTPDPRAWKIEFSQNELLDNWNMLTNHAATMRREGRVA